MAPQTALLTLLASLTAVYYGMIEEVDSWIGKILDKIDEHGLTENTMVVFTSDHGEMLGTSPLYEC